MKIRRFSRKKTNFSDITKEVKNSFLSEIKNIYSFKSFKDLNINFDLLKEIDILINNALNSSLEELKQKDLKTFYTEYLHLNRKQKSLDYLVNKIFDSRNINTEISKSISENNSFYSLYKTIRLFIIEQTLIKVSKNITPEITEYIKNNKYTKTWLIFNKLLLSKSFLEFANELSNNFNGFPWYIWKNDFETFIVKTNNDFVENIKLALREKPEKIDLSWQLRDFDDIQLPF